jgi:hypothetical protein
MSSKLRYQAQYNGKFLSHPMAKRRTLRRCERPRGGMRVTIAPSRWKSVLKRTLP